MSTWHFFDLDTGGFTGRSYAGPAEALALNQPAGQGAYAAAAGEVVDHIRQRVRALQDDYGAQVLVLEAITPAAPVATAWATPVWSEEAGGWLMQPTLAALQREASAPVLAALATLDQALVRPLGELQQAQLLGEPAPAEAAARLQAIQAGKQLLRQHLSLIAASTSAAELASIGPMPTVEL